MSCTFDAACLTSAVNGAQPSFEFNRNGASYFGISAQFTSSNGVKCYTDNHPSFSPILQSGSITQTCIWAGGVQSLYCPGLKNSAIPTGTHTISYSAPDGYIPFSVTNFVVARSQATNTITVTSLFTKAVPTVTAKTTSTVTAPIRTTTQTSTATVGGGTYYANDISTISTRQNQSRNTTITVTQDFTTTVLVHATQTQTNVQYVTTGGSAPNNSPSTVTLVSTTTSNQPAFTSMAPATTSRSSFSSSSSGPNPSISATSTFSASSSSPSSSPASSSSISNFSATNSSSSSSSSSGQPSTSSTSSSSSSSTYAAPPTTVTTAQTSTMLAVPSTSSSSSAVTVMKTTTVTNSSAPTLPSSSSSSAATTNSQIMTTSQSYGPGPAQITRFTSITAASSTNSKLVCPTADGQTYKGFIVECYSDRANAGSDFVTEYTDTLRACIDLCQSTSGCIDVSWAPGIPGPCYMKNKIVPIQKNANIWGARNTAAPYSTSMASAAATSGTTSSAAAMSSIITCPENDRQQYTAPSGDVFRVECYNDREDHDITSGNPVTVPASDLKACMNACDANADCVDVTLSGVACYLKNGIGTSQTGDHTAYGGRLITSKIKTILATPARRKRAAKHGPIVVSHSQKAHVSIAPRAHARDLMGMKMPMMLLNNMDERACPGGCSGWAGPDSTWTDVSTKYITTTKTITTTPTVSNTKTITVKNMNSIITAYETVTATQAPRTVLTHSTVAATTRNSQISTATFTLTNIHTTSATSTATTTTNLTSYVSCPYTFTTMTVTTHSTTTTTKPYNPTNTKIDSTTTTTSTIMMSSTPTIHMAPRITAYTASAQVFG